MIEEVFNLKDRTFMIGVISDTHIPDRVHSLHPALLEQLRGHHVDLILHGGDVSIRSVLTTLESVAPVRAVTGNRDFLLARDHPVSRLLKINGVLLALTHGHLTPSIYWRDKIEYVTRGYMFERYQKRLARAFPMAEVIVFGHTHHAENVRMGGKLYFNPGSVSHGDYLDTAPKYGLLRIDKDGRIDAQILPLTGARIEAKEWVEST
jgi:putative phosphoesterase